MIHKKNPLINCKTNRKRFLMHFLHRASSICACTLCKQKFSWVLGWPCRRFSPAVHQKLDDAKSRQTSGTTSFTTCTVGPAASRAGNPIPHNLSLSHSHVQSTNPAFPSRLLLLPPPRLDLGSLPLRPPKP